MTPIQSIDLAALTAAPQASGPQTQVTAYDLARFQEAYANASPAQVAAPPAVEAISPGFQAILQNFESLNGRVASIGELTQRLEAGATPTAGDMMQLTVKCHEFLFHAELTTNVANRTSDGVQQLFRQQS
ncbi:hypothetical protein [Dokdonella sp.]|uniref:hypothetical protein n=1 Tax=Dokdonella sp. TaxID=2291710 RepID=UPI00263A0F82|nr:hypothetical protein [Dokdonella sp.]